MSWRRIAAAWAGPLLITGFVLFALRGFVFHDQLTNGHPDLLAFWLPRWTFLGRALAGGEIPLWNPYEMTGYRFAADPQSGWLYAAPSLLFSVLSPGVAMRAMVVANPLLAGLGLYGFLRMDGLGRVAATLGALSLAGLMAGSEIAIAMPFAGALAWSSVLLLAAAGYRRADRWGRRLVWLGLGGFAWSQVASAHLSHGLAVGTVLVIAYLVANAVGESRESWARAGLFLLALPLLSLAVLVPRLQFLEASSLDQGYDQLGAGIEQVVRVTERPIDPDGVWAGWPLAFAAAPGAYAGAAVLLAVPFALRARRRRLVWAFGGVMGLTFVLLLHVVLGATWVRDLLLRLPYGDVVLHNPGRLRYVAVFALPVLAAAGMQGLLDRPPGRRETAAWLAGGVAVFLFVPLASGASPRPWILFAAAAVPAAALLFRAAREHRWAPAVVAVLALELVAGAVLAGRHTGDEIRTGLEAGGTPLHFQPLRNPDVDLGAFLRPTAFVEAIGTERYLTWAPPAAAYEKGYLFSQEPADWPALANERGVLFELHDALGYNPVQLPRYWSWIRATNPLPVFYNAVTLARPTEGDVRALGVRYLVVPDGVAPTVGGQVVATADGYALFEVAQPALRAELASVWTVASSTAEALALVTGDGDTIGVVLEDDPGIASAPATIGAPGSALLEETGLGTLRVTVGADQPAVLVIRNAYDPGWEATVNGVPTPVLPADGFVQALAVPAGDHEVLLAYRDPWVTRGLLGSAAAWGALALAGTAAWAAGRRDRSAR